MKGEKFKIFLSSNRRQQIDGLHMSKFRSPHVQKQIIPKPLLFKETKEKTSKTSVWQPGPWSMQAEFHPAFWRLVIGWNQTPAILFLFTLAFSKFIKIVDLHIKWKKVFFLDSKWFEFLNPRWYGIHPFSKRSCSCAIYVQKYDACPFVPTKRICMPIDLNHTIEPNQYNKNRPLQSIRTEKSVGTPFIPSKIMDFVG